MSNSEENDKFREYNQALIHSVTCKEKNCNLYNGRCQKVRASIDHFNKCYGPRRKISPIDSCESCMKIWGLLCFHAKICLLKDQCTIPQCIYIQKKMVEKESCSRNELVEAQHTLLTRGSNSFYEEDWSVERRKEAAEIARLETMEMLEHLRYAKDYSTLPYQ